ncbi:MAG: hypothetical protein ACK5IB_14950 [Qingshengfaniella sp.]
MVLDLALDLTVEHIVLLGRLEDRWIRIGTARHGSGAFNAQCQRLVALAQAWQRIDPSARPACYLLMPEDHVLRVAVPIPPGTDPSGWTSRDLAMRLASVSPDPVEGLRFDWRITPGRLHFATVPERIMDEAQTYAHTLGFQPLGTLAATGGNAFAGTAWFGLTGPDAADTPLPGGHDIVTLDRRQVAAHLPEDLERSLAESAEATLRTTQADRKGPPRKDGGRWGWAWSGRPLTRPLALTAALIAGLIMLSVWRGMAPPDGDTALALDPGEEVMTAEELTEAADHEGEDTDPTAENAPRDPDQAPRSAETTIGPDYFTPSPELLERAWGDTGPLDQLVLPATDPELGNDALALTFPALPAIDQLPPPLKGPPPPDRTYAIDARGLVLPAKDGRESPEGYLVFAGAPSKHPAARPERPPQIDTPAAPAVMLRASLADNDPLKRILPRARPATLVEQYERDRLGGRSEREMVGLRPAARPRSVQEAPTPIATASPPLAQASAPRPRTRPAERLQRATPAAPQTATAPRTVVAPGTADTASTGSLADQATQRNALNLSKVNLLGTFGSNSTLRALVRMPDGKVLNVAVGDRMDGGRVQAITRDALTYEKSGRPVILRMPNS